MSSLHLLDKIEAIGDAIDLLESELLDRERAALDLTGTEIDAIVAAHDADVAKARLRGLMAEHFILSRFLIRNLRPSGERRAA